MAGGDEVDLIYTANYCYYKEQVEKAGFMELTEEFLNKYMPQTMATLPESAWKETLINGKIYMVPRSPPRFSRTEVLLSTWKSLRNTAILRTISTPMTI